MRHSQLPLPAPDQRQLLFFVREPFPSRATGIEVQEGLVAAAAPLQVTSEMDEGGVLFGDGIESDRLEFAFGARVQVGCADRVLRLVRAK